MRTTPRAIGHLLLGLAVSGCATTEPQHSSVEPTAEVRPSVPDGWSVVTSHQGDLELAIPGDFEVLLTDGGVMAQPPLDRAAAGPTLEIWAQAPASLVQPTGGETVHDWLARTGWLPRAGEGGVTATADGTQQYVILPSGPATRVAVTAQPGSPDESRVVVYAIETADGVAILRFIGFPPERLDERTDELALVARLVRFGEELGG